MKHKYFLKSSNCSDLVHNAHVAKAKKVVGEKKVQQNTIMSISELCSFWCVKGMMIRIKMVEEEVQMIIKRKKRLVGGMESEEQMEGGRGIFDALLM